MKGNTSKHDARPDFLDPLEVAFSAAFNAQETARQTKETARAFWRTLLVGMTGEEYDAALVWARSLTETNCWVIDWHIGQQVIGSVPPMEEGSDE